MKSFKITMTFFRHKPTAIAILVCGLWLGGTISSFGDINISASTNVNCSGSIAISGNVDCGNCEGSPTVYVDLGHGVDKPNVTFDQCIENTFFGTYGQDTNNPEMVSLNAGVNILTPSDSCGDVGDSVSVASNGGGAGTPVIFYSQNDPKISDGTRCGISNPNTISCLKSNYLYNCYETIDSTTCNPGNCPPVIPNGDSPQTSSSTCTIVLSDKTTGPCPASMTYPNACDSTCVIRLHIADNLTPHTDLATDTSTRECIFTTSPQTLTVSISAVDWEGTSAHSVNFP
jgi:hypothetical protein